MSERSTTRLTVLRVLVLALLATLLGRLWFLQVYAADDFAQAATANQTRQVDTPAPRGEIYDARGRLLVRNRPALVVSVDRLDVRRQPDDGRAVLARLAELLGKDPVQLERQITPCSDGAEQPCWRGSPYGPVPVAQYDAGDPAQLATVLAIEERREDYPGVRALLTPVREYPLGTTASHLLGYLGPVAPDEVGTTDYEGVSRDALVGRAGVEASYDAALRGRDGSRELLVDNLGGIVDTASQVRPRPGDSLVLSIDSAVQQAAERALQRGLARARALPSRGGDGLLRADSGSVVVMEARTGRVLAMASAPAYDPTIFIGGASPEQYASLVDEARGAPLVFRAVQGAYAPASTFKVVSAAAAVDRGGYSLSARYDCPGVYEPTGQRNFDSADLGRIDLRTALVKSCDTVFYRFGHEMWQRDGGNRPVAEPADAMLATARSFGLGEPTGVDLPSERRGTLADRGYLQRRWEQTRDNRCAGADNPELSTQRRQANREFCQDGFRLRGGDATNFAIGQGDTLVTPLQLAGVYAAVANGGTRVTPRVGRALLGVDGQVREIEAAPAGRVDVDPDVLGAIREALSGVTQPGGTAAGAFAGAPVAVAGKTGTGEVGGKQDTSWFASFAPAAAPELVVVGVVSQGGTGGTVAAPMVREVYDAIYGPGGIGPRPVGLPSRRADGSMAPAPLGRGPGP